MDFAALQAAIAHLVRVGTHGREGLRKHGLLLDEVRASIAANGELFGELFEDYPGDPRGPSCLILCFLPGDNPVHTVWAWNGRDEPFLITVYRPGPPKYTADGRIRL